MVEFVGVSELWPVPTARSLHVVMLLGLLGRVVVEVVPFVVVALRLDLIRGFVYRIEFIHCLLEVLLQPKINLVHKLWLSGIGELEVLFLLHDLHNVACGVVLRVEVILGDGCK